MLEARGLDAAPALMAKLEFCGDRRAVEILAVIQRDEIEHVRIGNHWYAHLCAERGLDPLATFQRLLEAYGAPALRPPFDLSARRRAGFNECERAWFRALATRRDNEGR